MAPRRRHRRGPRHDEGGQSAKRGAGRTRGFAIPGLPSVLGRAADDLIQAVRDAPRGYATFGKALAADLMYRDALRYAHAAQAAKQSGRKPPPKPSSWSVMMPRTRALGRQVAKGTAEDLRHPLRHPGRTLLTLASVGTGAATAGTRAASALSAAKAAARAPRPRAQVTVSRKRARELDPAKLGVERLRKGLEADQPKGPLRAGTKAVMRRPTKGERAVAAGQGAYLASRRQRAAEELETKQRVRRRARRGTR